MNIHEFQAKQLFNKYGISVPNGQIASTPVEAISASKQIGGDRWIVKAQVHTGGRGKAGGVKIAETIDEVKKHAESILGMTLRTKQTGPEGKIVHTVLVEETSNIDREIYLSLLTDRAHAKVVVVASAEGGMEIEELAENHPEKIAKEYIAIETGIRSFHITSLAQKIGITKNLYKDFVKLCKCLYQLYLENDCSLVEINPLVITKEEKIVALDGKIGFDENALYRQKNIMELRDAREEDPREASAAEEGFSYVSLDGSIGCMVNGAGLAMATMDLIKSYGGMPANFLDVGGSATIEKVKTAFKLILSDGKVKAVLINIFGGIMKCDVIAEGIVGAVKDLGVNVPLVVRLEGTNVERGKDILDKSGLQIQAANTFAGAAKRAVEASS